MIADALEAGVALGSEYPARKARIDCQRNDTLEEHAVPGAQSRQAQDLGAVQTEFHWRRSLEAHARVCRAVAVHFDLDRTLFQGAGECPGESPAALHHIPGKHPGQGRTEAESEIVCVQNSAAAGGAPQEWNVDPWVERDECSLMKTKGHRRLGPVVDPQHPGAAA